MPSFIQLIFSLLLIFSRLFFIDYAITDFLRRHASFRFSFIFTFLRRFSFSIRCFTISSLLHSLPTFSSRHFAHHAVFASALHDSFSPPIFRRRSLSVLIFLHAAPPAHLSIFADVAAASTRHADEGSGTAPRFCVSIAMMASAFANVICSRRGLLQLRYGKARLAEMVALRHSTAWRQ